MCTVVTTAYGVVCRRSRAAPTHLYTVPTPPGSLYCVPDSLGASQVSLGKINAAGTSSFRAVTMTTETKFEVEHRADATSHRDIHVSNYRTCPITATSAGNDMRGSTTPLIDQQVHTWREPVGPSHVSRVKVQPSSVPSATAFQPEPWKDMATTGSSAETSLSFDYGIALRTLSQEPAEALEFSPEQPKSSHLGEIHKTEHDGRAHAYSTPPRQDVRSSSAAMYVSNPNVHGLSLSTGDMYDTPQRSATQSSSLRYESNIYKRTEPESPRRQPFASHVSEQLIETRSYTTTRDRAGFTEQTTPPTAHTALNADEAMLSKEDISVRAEAAELSSVQSLRSALASWNVAYGASLVPAIETKSVNGNASNQRSTGTVGVTRLGSRRGALRSQTMLSHLGAFSADIGRFFFFIF